MAVLKSEKELFVYTQALSYLSDLPFWTMFRSFLCVDAKSLGSPSWVDYCCEGAMK